MFIELDAEHLTQLRGAELSLADNAQIEFRSS